MIFPSSGVSVVDVDVPLDLFRGRALRGLRRIDRLVDQRQYFLVDLVEFGIGQFAGLGHLRAELLQAVVLFAQSVQLALAAVGLRIADEMAVVAALFGEHPSATNTGKPKASVRALRSSQPTA